MDARGLAETRGLLFLGRWGRVGQLSWGRVCGFVDEGWSFARPPGGMLVELILVRGTYTYVNGSTSGSTGIGGSTTNTGGSLTGTAGNNNSSELGLHERMDPFGQLMSVVGRVGGDRR
jgi:hypothetical protein